jgi:Transposase DDE domain
MVVLLQAPRPKETAAVSSIKDALRRIKAELADLLPGPRLAQLARDAGLAWRQRLLTPATTAQLFLTQVLHGNTAVGHLRHLCGLDFTDAAYCQARARLPSGFFWRLQRLATGQLAAGGRDGLWRGHRTFHIDGSSFSMPDTAELRQEFGQPGNQAPGCGFPTAHLLVLFDAHGGFLRKAVAAPLRTHDLRHAPAMHAELAPGDVLVGDRAFGSFAHLALCRSRGLHAVFRLHQRRPRGARRDRRVTYRKGRERPAWLSARDYAALPEALAVREVRVRVGTPGGRTRALTLVTTLLDRRRYPARALAALYGARWSVETNLRHLKQSLGMDVLRCQSLPGVLKELAMFVVAYNLVRRVMRTAARRQGVAPGRVSFVDALRWLRCARPGEEVPRLRVNPQRPGRHEPRVKKRRPKQYDLMRRPREELRQKLFKKRRAA